MEKKREFLLIKQHTDEEITFFLRREAEKGWWLSASKGNWFIFEKKRVPGARVMALTVSAPNLGEGADETIRNEYDDLREKGWDIYVRGEIENLRDSQRHVFLYSTDEKAEIIKSDEKKMKLVWLSGFIRSMANLAMSMIYTSFLLFLLTSYTSKGFLFWYGVIPFVFSILLFISSLSAFIVSLISRKRIHKCLKNGSYRILDISTRLSTLILILMAIFLVLDSAFRGF